MTDQEIFAIIEREVCDYIGILPKLLPIKNRNRLIIDSRQFIYYFARRYTKLSTPKLAAIYNQKHCTVITSDKTIQNHIQVNGYKPKAEFLEQKFTELRLIKLRDTPTPRQ